MSTSQSGFRSYRQIYCIFCNWAFQKTQRVLEQIGPGFSGFTLLVAWAQHWARAYGLWSRPVPALVSSFTFSFDTSKWHLLAIVDLLRSAKFKVGKKSVHREFLIFDRNFAKIKIKGGKKNKIAKLRKFGSDASSDKKNFENDFWSRSEIATDETRFRGHLLFEDHTTRTASAFFGSAWLWPLLHCICEISCFQH